MKTCIHLPASPLYWCGTVALALLSALASLHAASANPASRMIGLPGGSFMRSDGKEVRVDGLSLLSTEVTWSQFKTVRDWAEQHGYAFEEGIGQADLPAQNVTWYDAVKWCNALSEKTGRKPVYFTDTGRTAVYRQGRAELTGRHVDWAANGFRLPTEAEWEYAYRAGTTTNFFWGNFARTDAINHRYAAFHEWGSDEIDGGPIPVASKRPNPFGLYDMAGNVEEWVWDRYAIGYAGVSSENPHGPDSGPLRVLRGGGFVIDRLFSATDRHPTYPFFVNCDIGFRIASSDPKADAGELAAIAPLPVAGNAAKAFSEPLLRLDIREDTDEAACARLVPLLDMANPNLGAFRAAWERKDFAGALSALRDLYVPKLKECQREPFQSSYVSMKDVDRWMGLFGQKRPICWVGAKTDLQSCWDFAMNDHLARAYAKFNKQEYADAFFWMLNDVSLNAKPVWNRLTKIEKGSAGLPRDSFYSFIGFDAGAPFRPFVAIAWMLRHNLPTQAVPPRVFANTLYSSVVDHLAAGLQDDRGVVPNQVWGNASEMLEFSTFFGELNDASLLRAEALARFHTATGTVLPDGSDLEASLNYNAGLFSVRDNLLKAFPDRAAWPGWLADFNRRADYRYLMYASLATPFGTYPGIGNQTAEDLRPRKQLKGWIEGGQLVGMEVPMNLLLRGTTAKAGMAPAFTSVGLPYGGYYVQRSGWSIDDLYLFMRSSRDGVGHNHEDNNNIQVAAYGAWLLCDRGSPAYVADHLPEHQKKYRFYFNEHGIGNVFESNALAVDGLEQTVPAERLPAPTAGWTTPRKNLLHYSARFDVTEGVFDGWYESEKPISDKEMNDLLTDHGLDAIADIAAYNARLKREGERRLHIRHRRLALFLRDEKFWVLVDEVDGGSEFTQTWNFPPADRGLNTVRYFLAPPEEDLYRGSGISTGYTPDEVRSDENGRRIVTISHRRPNIAILNYSAAPVRYRQHYGAMFPFRGWHSFGIGGEKVPAVQMEGSWRGDVPMVTVLYPMKSRPGNASTLDAGLEGFRDRSTEEISGFSRAAKAGLVSVQAARTPRLLTAGPVTVTARLLLVRDDGRGGLAGVILGGDRLAAGDRSAGAAAKGDFEFSFKANKWEITPIRAPGTFRWEKKSDGQLSPAYEP